MVKCSFIPKCLVVNYLQLPQFNDMIYLTAHYLREPCITYKYVNIFYLKSQIGKMNCWKVALIMIIQHNHQSIFLLFNLALGLFGTYIQDM